VIVVIKQITDVIPSRWDNSCSNYSIHLSETCLFTLPTFNVAKRIREARYFRSTASNKSVIIPTLSRGCVLKGHPVTADHPEEWKCRRAELNGRKDRWIFEIKLRRRSQASEIFWKIEGNEQGARGALCEICQFRGGRRP
jgi:hypothetical protein